MVSKAMKWIAFLVGSSTVDVVVQYPESLQNDVRFLQTLKVRTPSGAFVPLEQVVDITTNTSAPNITRIDGERTLLVTADADKRHANIPAITQAIDSFLADILLAYPSVRSIDKGENDGMNNALKQAVRINF